MYFGPEPFRALKTNSRILKSVLWRTELPACFVFFLLGTYQMYQMKQSDIQNLYLLDLGDRHDEIMRRCQKGVSVQETCRNETRERQQTHLMYFSHHLLTVMLMESWVKFLQNIPGVLQHLICIFPHCNLFFSIKMPFLFNQEVSWGTSSLQFAERRK